MTVRTSRGTRKDDIVLVGRCGYYGAITKSSIQGPHCPPAPASAEVCGDDGNMELEEMETSQQQHLILVIQYKRILSTATHSKSVPVLVSRCA